MTGAYGRDPRRWEALTVPRLAGFTVLLDVSIASVARPSIRHCLGTTRQGSSWSSPAGAPRCRRVGGLAGHHADAAARAGGDGGCDRWGR